MKIATTLLLVFLALGLRAQQVFGDTITSHGAMTGHDLGHALHQADSMAAKVTGTVKTVCQKKGCWMTLDVGHGQTMRVTFKDYGFFVPKDCAGKTVVIEGMAYKQLISVEELQHYAEDEGKTREEIDAITQPKTELRFVAHGVLLL
jgi:hypothetical protein